MNLLLILKMVKSMQNLMKVNNVFRDCCLKHTINDKCPIVLEDSDCKISIVLKKGEHALVYGIEKNSTFGIFENMLPCNDFTMLYCDENSNYYLYFFELKHKGQADFQLSYGKYYWDFIENILKKYFEVDINIKHILFFKVKARKNHMPLVRSKQSKGGLLLNSHFINIDSKEFTCKTILSGYSFSVSKLHSL